MVTAHSSSLRWTPLSWSGHEGGLQWCTTQLPSDQHVWIRGNKCQQGQNGTREPKLLRNASACIDSSTKTSTFSYFLKHTQTHSVQRYLSLFFFLLFLTHHISKVICCVISLCWPPAHEIQHLLLLLSPYNCFIFLHTGSSTGSCIILLRLNKAAVGFFLLLLDLSLPLLYHSLMSGGGMETQKVSKQAWSEGSEKHFVCWPHLLTSGSSNWVVFAIECSNDKHFYHIYAMWSWWETRLQDKQVNLYFTR